VHLVVKESESSESFEEYRLSSSAVYLYMPYILQISTGIQKVRFSTNIASDNLSKTLVKHCVKA